MSKFRRDLKKAPIPNKTTRGTEIIAACTGNAAIGDVAAPLAAFVAANGSLGTTAGQIATANAALTTLITHQGSDSRAWDVALETLLAAVESNTKGATEPMQTTTVATFEPGAGTPASAIGQVQNLHTSMGDMPHEQDLQWDANRPRPNVYILQMCDDPYDESRMVQIGTPSGSKFTAKNLTPGKKWFRAAAVGTGDQHGPWSDPATGTVI